MGIVKRTSAFLEKEKILSIQEMDSMFFSQIQMNGEKVLKKFPEQFADTKKRVLEGTKIQNLMESFPIDEIRGDSVMFADGAEISSQMLARVLGKSKEVILGVITVHGYDVIEENASAPLEMIFTDGWGTAIAECTHALIIRELKKNLEIKGIYATNSWSPGQHNINIAIQKQLFEVLKPDEIGVKLSSTFMMSPKKSISYFIGIGTEKSLEDIRPCDFCNKRDTCPSAYK